MKKLQTIVAAFAIMAGLVAVSPLATYATPASQIDGGAGGVVDPGTPSNLPNLIKNVVDILLFIIGAVAVVMIIIGGIRYVVSGGDSSSVTAAKNTILYAVIGLIVAMLAYAIVHFVVTSVK